MNLKSQKSDLLLASYLICVGVNRPDISNYGGIFSTLGMLTIFKKYLDKPYESWDFDNPDNKDYLVQSMPQLLLKSYRNSYHNLEVQFDTEHISNILIKGNVLKHDCPNVGIPDFDKLPKLLKLKRSMFAKDYFLAGNVEDFMDITGSGGFYKVFRWC